MRVSSTVFGNLTQNGAVWRAKPPTISGTRAKLPTISGGRAKLSSNSRIASRFHPSRPACSKKAPPAKRGFGREGASKCRYTANTTEQMLKRTAPNTKVNTIMGQTNLNQWDIFMSSICSVAITRPVGAM